MRRHFELPEEDEEYLDSFGLDWETVITTNVHWLFIHKFPIPDGFNHIKATLAIRIAGYPQGPLDMAYFNPPLGRKDGQTINALSPIVIDGENFQQWSRHYKWRAGEDSLVTHIAQIPHWLTKEFSKR